MRLATWNLDARTRPGTLDLLRSLDADVLLLTEVPPDLELPDYELTRSAGAMTRDQAYSAVASRLGLQPMTAPHAASAAAVVGGVVHVASVLPWRGAEQDVWSGTSTGERTVACVDALDPFLREQAAVVWGGDWNHTLSGGLHGSSPAGRERLERLLADLRLDLPTRDCPRGTYDMATIDHVALRDPAAVAEHVPVERRLSDHDAYVVTTG